MHTDPTYEGLCFFYSKPSNFVVFLVIHDKILIAFGDESFKFLTYQLSMVGHWPTMEVTGNRELGFDSGEGARESATTSKAGSRRANDPILTQGGSDKK